MVTHPEDAAHLGTPPSQLHVEKLLVTEKGRATFASQIK